MIKFFRRIRQQLLTENKFSKYLLYAIGEIILVVIGILIALQVNNWREEQQDIKVFNLIIKEIGNNIRLDSIEMAIDVNDIKKQIECLEFLMNNDKSIPNDSLSTCIARIMHTHWPDYNTTGIEQLKNSKNVPIKTDSLIDAIYDYYLYSSYQEEVTPLFFTTQVENLRDYLINEELPPAGAGAYAKVIFDENDIRAYKNALKKPELQIRLKHLHNNRLHMLEYYQKRMQFRCHRLLHFLKLENEKD